MTIWIIVGAAIGAIVGTGISLLIPTKWLGLTAVLGFLLVFFAAWWAST